MPVELTDIEKGRLSLLNNHLDLRIPENKLFSSISVKKITFIVYNCVTYGALNINDLGMSLLSVRKMYSKARGFANFVCSDIPTMTDEAIARITKPVSLTNSEKKEISSLNDYFNWGISENNLFSVKSVQRITMIAYNCIIHKMLDPNEVGVSLSSLKKMYSKAEGYRNMTIGVPAVSERVIRKIITPT